MPESLNIAIFVFGAVLVLIGLLGGKFKLFVAEVSGTVGLGPRIASLIFGCGLIAWGLWGEARQPVITENTPRGGNPRHSDPVVPPEPALAINLSGVWQDETGTVYQVTSQGSSFEFHANNSASGISAEGRGTFHGLNWESSFRTNYSATGTGRGMISADGNRMIGSFTDTRYGAYSHTITRFQ